ncbi:hypothetical protein J7K27_06655 [Candidatus Bathyarchaeota archaeon]|nr:hypothetical protein [Candidatus Bathyarchaeota archaeon]
MKAEEFIEEFSQLPSKTGKDVIDLEEYAKLPRVRTYEFIRGFLEGCRKSKEVRALFIVAEWGEGKTSICEGLLRKPEVIKSDLVIPISTKRIITFAKERSEQFSDTGSIGIRFFACLLYAIKDVIENDLIEVKPFSNMRILPKKENEATVKFIKKALDSILKAIDPKSRIFIFLDEFEDVVDEYIDIQTFIIGGLVEVINGYPRLLWQDPYAGRFHLIIAATPPAFAKIKAGTYTDRQRLFGQRALEVELEKLDRKNAYNYILGILKYCWNGKLPRIPFCKPGMFNAIYSATLGNPRSIINVIELLLTQAKLSAPEGKMRLVNPDEFISILSGQRIQVYGGAISILDKESLSRLYGRLEDKCREQKLDVNKCIRLTNLLLSNLTPASIEAIKEELGFGDDFFDYLNVIGTSFNNIWNIEPFIFFKKIVKGQEEIYSKIESPSAHPSFAEIVKTLEFYEFNSDNSSLVKALFVPFKRLSKIAFENESMYRNYIDFFIGENPEIGSEDEIRVIVDREIYDKIETSKENYIMLSPAALNIFYPPPSAFLLDFIEDLDKRFEIGNELMRSLINFGKEFHEGLIELIKDGCEGRRIEVSRDYESYGFKHVEVLTFRIDQQFDLRACIFSPLKTTEAQNEIKKLMDEIKTAYVPLLMIFSWNPLPIEIKATLETLFGPKEGPEKIFHYIELPLTTNQCFTIVGYAIAKNKESEGYKIKHERWKARASRIIDELKFDNRLREFIDKGKKDGYTIGVLQLPKPSEATGILRALLITEGSIKDRYEQIRQMEEKFRIYGRDFPVCPIDIESENAFEKLVKVLEENKIVRRVNGNVETERTNIENRILSILREYGRPMQKDEIDKLFVTSTSDGHKFTTEIYLKILEERREVEFRKNEGYCIRDIKHLEREFSELKKKLHEYRKRYEQYPYGYIISTKQRKRNAIIIKECLAELSDLAESYEKIRFVPGYEKTRTKQYLLFGLLMEQLEKISDLLDEFERALLTRDEYRIETVTVKKAFESLEESLNGLKLFPKTIKFKEKEQMDEKEKEIREIEEKTYSREELKDMAQELEREIDRRNLKGLYESYRGGCLVFDAKLVQIASIRRNLKNFIDNCRQLLSNVQQKLADLTKLKNAIEEHEILTAQYPYDDAPFSYNLQNWVKQNLENIIGGK